MISIQNEVQVDTAGLVKMCTLDDYRQTVRGPTWRALLKVAKSVKDKKLRIAFFSATPQGGGVALMRHALLRLFRLLGIQGQWYVKSWYYATSCVVDSACSEVSRDCALLNGR